jgi:hypothetical protein
MENRSKLKKKFVAATIFWGVVLAIGGVLYGNQSPLVPDFKLFEEAVQQEKLNRDTLNCWITHQRADFKIIEFAKVNACSQQFNGMGSYSCYPESYLNNPKWLRTAFQKTDKQLIVFSDTQKKSLYAAARLKFYGNKARMLDQEGVVVFNAPVLQKQKPLQPAVEPVLQPHQLVSAPVVKSAATVVEQSNEAEGC